jgi:hypothetical protein
VPPPRPAPPRPATQTCKKGFVIRKDKCATNPISERPEPAGGGVAPRRPRPWRARGQPAEPPPCLLEQHSGFAQALAHRVSDTPPPPAPPGDSKWKIYPSKKAYIGVETIKADPNGRKFNFLFKGVSHGGWGVGGRGGGG